jgi:hypothetical protein
MQHQFDCPKDLETAQNLAKADEVLPFGTVFAPVISLSGDTT